MRVDLEPSANLAARATSAPSAAGHNNNQQLPTKHKPMIQARRNNYEDYRNLKDRDFLSIHEEVTHLRQCTRDQERIIGLLKEEKNRLLSDLLQKGKDLQHYKDLLKRPQSNDERSQLDEMRRTLAERDCTIDELKSEVVRLNGIYQRTIEDNDDVASQLQHMEQQVFNAQQEAANKTADVERLEKNIEMLNEEMTARINNIHRDVNLAAEVGKRDASTDHHMLEDELKKTKDTLAALEKKMVADEEQRRKERVTSSEAATERMELMAEVRRQQLLLSEVDDLKAQIEAFRLARATTEEIMREKLHVALLDIHDEKEISRKLMAEVDRKEDTIAAKEREIARLNREFEKNLQDACAGSITHHKELQQELNDALAAAQREKVLQVEETAKITIKFEALQQKLQTVEDDRVALKTSLDEATKERRTLQLRVHELEDAVADAQRALAAAAKDAEDAQQHDADAQKSKKVPVEPERTERDAEEWAKSKAAMEAREAELLEQQHALEMALNEALSQTEQLQVQVDALREAQHEHDHVRHSALAEEADDLRSKVAELEEALDVATAALEEEGSVKQNLLDELQQVRDSVASLEQERADLEQQVDEAHRAISTSEAEVVVAKQAIAQLETQQQLQANEQTSAAASSAAVDKRIDRLEREKKVLTEKLKMAEVAREDIEKSVDIRSQQLRKEAELRTQAHNELQDVRAALKKTAAERDAASNTHQAEVERLKATHVSDLDHLREEMESLKQRNEELATDNQRMKDIQMHW